MYAFSGIAAKTCGGATLDSFLALNFMKSGTYEEWSKLPIAKTVTPKVNNLDYFIIDEISFLSCEFFNYINKIFQSTF
jgi:hypothetical protein